MDPNPRNSFLTLTLITSQLMSLNGGEKEDDDIDQLNEMIVKLREEYEKLDEVKERMEKQKMHLKVLYRT